MSSKLEQTNVIFNVENSWQKEWKGMPEFIQKKSPDPYAKIIFRFDSEEDLKKFSSLIGQKLTKKTKSAWFPFRPHRSSTKKIYIDES